MKEIFRVIADELELHPKKDHELVLKEFMAYSAAFLVDRLGVEAATESTYRLGDAMAVKGREYEHGR